jgi:hypothetical protein
MFQSYNKLKFWKLEAFVYWFYFHLQVNHNIEGRGDTYH